MLIRKADRSPRRSPLTETLTTASGGVDRRMFLRRSGLTGGALAAIGTVSIGSLRKAEAGPPPKPGIPVETRKNVCTHCSVGCTVIAEVSNGVWIGQQPGC